MVGGADGVAKVYRVFRETQRRIGDDANLVRRLPKLAGRIFSVAVSPDGSRIAAAATLDGQSEVRVWKYDFNGKLSDELKKVMAKRVSNRKPEEREKVEAYRNAATEELARYRVDHAATYAVGFGPDNALLMASGDGVVRRLPDGAAQAEPLHRIEIQPADQSKRLTFDAARHHEMVAQRAEDMAAERRPAPEQVQSLRIEPAEIELPSPYAYAQLVVTATLRDGATVDVTRLCKITPPEFARVTPRGLVRPIDDGAGSIQVALGDLRDSIGLVSSGTDDGAVDFVRDVGPVLSQLGCNQGTCHGAQKGKNGFRLSLRGYDPVFDVRALTDDLAARRINLASPDASLMLRKPLGLAPHEGGVLISQGDPYHSVLRRWIADGSELELESPRVDRIAVSPVNPVAQASDARQQVRVVAHYTDGTSRDVTREAFIESGNTEVATTDGDGLLSAVRRGEAPILARYEGAYAATTLTVMGDRSGYREPDAETWSRIDELVAEKWQRVKVVPSGLCDDATFLRRVYLDLTGLPPNSDEVRSFLSDPAPSRVKRTAVVDRLIGSDPFIEYWTNKWADLLQVNRKFLGVEGSEKFRAWIRQAVAENRPYDEFARELLTATGSNNDNPAASYFKILRTPEDTMENTTHLFLGIRFNCNKCHDHPFERWTQDQYYEMAAFFARVGLHRDSASGNRRIGGTAVEGAKPLFEKVVDLDEGEVRHAGTGKVVPPTFPFPVEHEATEDATRRRRLASWITDPDNPYFARSYVNRLWSYLLGTGLIEPVDDIRAGNPPTNPRLLDHLTRSFVDSGFDMRQILRMICTSRTYQLSVETNPLNEDDALNYSHAIPRRLPAEVIYDAVHAVTGAVSDIPGVEKGTRAAELTDAGVKLADGFLQNLGRPVRESACECERSSELQLGPVMALINGPTIGSAISDPKNELERMVREIPDDGALTEEIFLRVLGRFPSDAEMAACERMTGQIREDHEALVRRLEQAEAEWERRHAELEAERKEKLAATENQIAERKKAIAPDRARLEKARLERIEQAKEKLAGVREELAGRADAWAAEQQLSTEWHPLLPTELSSTNQAKLVAREDRSVVATGAKDKGVYTVKFRSNLSGITGFRIEAMADPQLPSSGPGLAGNGNFVLTELEIEAAPASAPENRTPVKIASGQADFSQNGFSVDATFDGKRQDQGGWAIAGATGVVHWASLKLAEPLAYKGGVVLTVQLHQFHNAAEHRLGRFRISATTAAGEIPLGLPESFASTVATPETNRGDEDRQRIAAYLGATDAKVKQAQAELAKSRQPVPPDETLTRLEQQRERLSQPIGVDPDLVRLREDVAHSGKQLENLRLTAAEDLTWALVNSPAFLFNR